MADISPERKSGCGLLTAVFSRGTYWLKRSSSSGSTSLSNNGINATKSAGTPSSRRRRGSDDVVFIDQQPKGLDVPLRQQNTRNAYNVNHQQIPGSYYPRQAANKGPPPDRPTVAPSSVLRNSQPYVSQGRKVPRDAVGISGELESMIADHQKSKGSSTLVRASSSNVMLAGSLGNLRQSGTTGVSGSNDILDYLPTTANEKHSVPKGSYPESTTKKSNAASLSGNPSSSLCRALSTRMDPETLKILGNEDYKNGKFVEALALYEAAISIDPNKASYRSNKSAALTALGRIIEALLECKEAIRIEPSYHRAHNRLATLYVRLGEAEKAMYHYKYAGPDADPDVVTSAKALQLHLQKCTEARQRRDWNSLIRECRQAVSSYADSAPQIFALQAEALMKLNRHEEAEAVLTKGPRFDVDSCTKFLGPIGSANLLTVRAQVDMATGRFDEAVEAAQRAVRLDSNNKEAHLVVRKAQAVAAARSRGNELFKAQRFLEAAKAYGEGLEFEPYNSILLCNRAACLAKLGQFEHAVADCTSALNVHPSYSKARLRRADCSAKLARWQLAKEDYAILVQESPDNEELKQSLSEADRQLRGGSEMLTDS
ncbi:hypothetical protein MLD38_028465 [Melastoma candidum]|uniref:Uncharacterized protein n=1 Tax=Melastoma candidum TaxID=119954 RepID=A0ACB9N0V2_9MYRT|nr:hypothetical protein MLD38_028465 [Melastoma candidum]